MIHLVGDINLTDGFFDTGFGVGTSITNGSDPFEKIERKNNDVWVGNFEGVTANVSSRFGLYRKQFIISPESLRQIRHFDYYNVANNHTMQHGLEAFNQMLENIESFGSTFFGTKKCHSVSFLHQEKKVSITSFSLRKENFDDSPLYWNNPEFEEVVKEFETIAENKFKILYLHWGNEFINRPYLEQKKMARFFVDTGFDLIIGMHPHLLQGYEIYKDKYIFYSIGNFVFNMPWEPLKYGAIIHVNLSHEIPEISTDYVYIENDYFPKVVSANHVPAYIQFESLNKHLLNEEANEQYYINVFRYMKKYRKSNYAAMLKNLHKFKFRDVCEIILDFLKRKISK